MARRRRTLPALPALLVAVAVLAVACSSPDDVAAPPAPPVPGETAPAGPPAPEVPDGRPLSPLTGLPLDSVDQGRALLAVKIDNAPAARPQSGLDAADVVIEELVEFGITRFMALFLADVPSVAGPVRSGRPVDADLLGGFGASVFAFSGARPEVQGLLASVPSVRVTEGAAGFFRDARRSAPHNLYIEPEVVRTEGESRGARPLVDVGWTFDPEVPEGHVVCPPSQLSCPDPGASIVIDMSAGYRTGWIYDAAEGVYRRDQNGQRFDVAGNGRIGAANVVILATRQYVGASGYDETDATTAGARAVILRDGRRYEATWVKPTARDLLLLQTVGGEPFPLKPGPTWIHLPSVGRMPALD
jgi:hypothetical protein